jgi:DNA polymerase III subunit alpha
MARYIFISVETSGLPSTTEIFLEFVAKGTLHHWDSSRLLQICWSLTDDKYVVFSKMFYTKPSKIIITPKTTEQTGLTQTSVSHAMDMKSVLSMLMNDLKIYDCDYIVGHNVDFDLSVIGSELLRLNMVNEKKILQDQSYYCTMKSFPLFETEQSRKLKDRYFFCFNTYPDLRHDARDEVNACTRLFFKLKQLSELIGCKEQ